MLLSRPARIALRVMTAFVLVFLYAPLAVITVLSFSSSKTFTWPRPGFCLQWWSAAFQEPGPEKRSSRR
jgi:putative spermidine/putrescine transport system permease protein